MEKYEITLSESQLNRRVLSILGLPKSISLKTFKSELLPQIPYRIEIRGAGFIGKQRHTKTYSVSDIHEFLSNTFVQV